MYPGQRIIGYIKIFNSCRWLCSCVGLWTSQVWNLNNLDADILHSNEIMKGAVKSVTVSSAAGLVACHGGVQGQAEVKLVEVSSGRVKGTLQQEPHVQNVSCVVMSAGGRYLITHNVWTPKEGDERREATLNWPLLSCVVLWDVEKQRPLLAKVNCRFAFFDRHGSTLGLVQCNFYSQFDCVDNMYSCSFWHLDSELSGTQEVTFDLPDCTEFIGEPALFHDRNSSTSALVCALQKCGQKCETLIYVRYLSKGGNGSGDSCGVGTKLNGTITSSDSSARTIHLKDLIASAETNNLLIADVKITDTNLLLVTYVQDVERFDFDLTQGLVVPQNVRKGAVLYDMLKDVVVRNMQDVFSPPSDVSRLQVSADSTVCVDQDLQVFDLQQGQQLCKVKADWCQGSARFALNGRYLVGVTSDCRSVQVYRAKDGVIKGSLLVHGKATHVYVGEDGRTIAVGTSDGRVLLLSLVLDLSDPYIELIQHFPSRNPPPPPSLMSDSGGGLLVDKDAMVVRGNTAELQRLSAKIRSDSRIAAQTRPSFQKVASAVMARRATSQACCVQ